MVNITSAQRALLERIAAANGTLMLISVTSAGGSMRNLETLINDDLAEVADHPTVKDRRSSKPVAALAITDKGRDQLAAPRSPSDRNQGRKPLIPDEPTTPFNVRLPVSLHEKLTRLGGAAWVRDRIAKAKEPK